MDEANDIELRSEKVRNIIGQIPTLIVRTGISVIFFIMSALLMVAYFYEYDTKLEVTSKLFLNNDTINYEIFVPYSEKRVVNYGQIIVFRIDYSNSVTSKINNIDSTIYINKVRNYLKIYGKIPTQKIKLIEQIEIPTIIFTGRTNIIEEIFKK